MTTAVAQHVKETLGKRAMVADLRLRIDRRHMQTGDAFRGGVVLHEVPSVEGRRADALAVDFRKSSPSLIGYEIKVARGDWLSELDHPEKAEAWGQHCTEWYVIAPDGIVNQAELPDGWGLITPVAKVRTVVRVAARKREPAPLPLPVVIELAKKLDTLRVTETAAATAKSAARIRELELAATLERGAEQRAAEDAAILRGMLARIGVDRDAVGTWTLTRGGSPEELVLAAALTGRDGLLRLHERCQRDLDNIRRLVGSVSARLDGKPDGEVFE